MKIVIYICLVLIVISVLFAGTRMFLSEPNTSPGIYVEFPVSGTDGTGVVQKVIPTTPGISPEMAVPFDELVTRTPAPAFQSMLDSVHLDSYAIFPCEVNDKETNVVMFTAKYTEDPVENTFEPAVRAIEAWESDALQDIGQFVYPKTSFAGLKSFFVTSESDPALRVSSTQVGSMEYYLYSKWVLNYVFYASSRSCLDEITDLVYGVH